MMGFEPSAEITTDRKHTVRKLNILHAIKSTEKIGGTVFRKHSLERCCYRCIKIKLHILNFFIQVFIKYVEYSLRKGILVILAWLLKLDVLSIDLSESYLYYLLKFKN